MDKQFGLKQVAKMIALGAMISGLLAGCGGGGGGGSSTVSAVTIKGTAAAGAPVVGYVAVSDSSSNTQPVKSGIPILADGTYTVDVTGLTAPYAFRADGTVGGKRVTLYSAATSDDLGKTINITPFTDLVLRNIANGVVDTFFANNASVAGLTTAQLNAKRDALTTILLPALTAMGVDSSIDLLRTAFNADNTGLDRFMDAVKVDTTTSTAVTITNILDAAHQLTIDTTSATALTTAAQLPATNLTLPANPSPLDLIVQGFNNMSAKFATSLPNPSDTSLTGLFDSSFVQDGQSLSAFLTDITTSTSNVGLKFTNVSVAAIDTTAGTAKVHFTPVKADGSYANASVPGGVMTWKFVRDINGNWLAAGNQRIAQVKVNSFVYQGVCKTASCTTNAGATTVYKTGLWLNIDQQGTAIGSAHVTGPGLPNTGVDLIAQIGTTWLKITTTNTNTACTDYFACNSNYWFMTDTEIGQIAANSQYVITLYDTSVTPVQIAQYTDTLVAAPVLNAAKATASYPTLASMTNPIGTAASTFTPSWTRPADLIGGWVSAYVFQNSGAPNYTVVASTWVDNQLTAATGTASLTITAPASGTWSGGGYDIVSFDQYARRVETQHNYY